MSVLSYIELKKIVEAGVITNVTDDMINGSSIDISIGNVVYFEDTCGEVPGIVCLSNTSSQRVPPLMRREELAEDGVIRLLPGQCMLAQSQQKFFMPDYLSAEVKLKSSVGRCFMNHMLAGWCDPTWNGSVITMEFKNDLQDHIIEIPVGTRVAQMIFMKHVSVPPHAAYAVRGRYNKDEEVKGMKQ